MEKATFAGGCFWCMVSPFEEQPGIGGIVSGYSGGHVENPTYEQVKTGTTGHFEVVEITFDPEIFPYERLLELYWQQIDPTDPDGQSKQAMAASGKFKKPIVTLIEPAAIFYPAEDYHQDYHKKNKQHYKEDREKSGRDVFIKEHW